MEKQTPTAHDMFLTPFIQSIGLKVATNLLIRMPPCVNFRGLEYHRGFMCEMFFPLVELMMQRCSLLKLYQ